MPGSTWASEWDGAGLNEKPNQVVISGSLWAEVNSYSNSAMTYSVPDSTLGWACNVNTEGSLGVHPRALYYLHDGAGDPWYDSVSNATGWHLSTRFFPGEKYPGAAYYGYIRMFDGVKCVIVVIAAKDEIKIWSGAWSGPFAINEGVWNDLIVSMKGADYEVYLNDVLVDSGTSTELTTAKTIQWGGDQFGYQGDVYYDYFKYDITGPYVPPEPSGGRVMSRYW